jgi:hypothetical protein
VRLNSREGHVVIPSALNEYALLQEGAVVLVAWTERTEQRRRELVLAEIDLETMKTEELLREQPAVGTPLSPQLVRNGDLLELAWLVRKGRGGGSRHELNLASLRRSPFEVVDRKVLDYGLQMRSFQLIGSDRGVFIVGASTPEKRAPMGLRLYRKGLLGWEALAGPTSKGSYDQQPVLSVDADFLHLAWVRDGRITLSRSADGLEWSDPQVLSGAGGSYPLFLESGNEELGLVWVTEEGKSASRILMATSSDQGANWWHASQNIELVGARCRLDAGFAREGSQTLIYHYWDSLENCEKLESCIMSSGWSRKRLDHFPGEMCGRSLSPSVLKIDNDLYLVWQERRGRQTGIAMNYAVSPWEEWLSTPRRLLDSQKGSTYVAPRLIFWKERMHLVCFAYQVSRGPMQRSLQFGDLLLFQLGIEGDGAGSARRRGL